jgi:hypothetical protein
MTSYLDIRTLAFTSAVVAVILFGYMLQLQLKSNTCPGFKLWTLAAVSAGLGLVLLALRGRVPDLISIVGANGLIILAMPLVCLGACRSNRRQAPGRATDGPPEIAPNSN